MALFTTLDEESSAWRHSRLAILAIRSLKKLCTNAIPLKRALITNDSPSQSGMHSCRVSLTASSPALTSRLTIAHPHQPPDDPVHQWRDRDQQTEGREKWIDAVEDEHGIGDPRHGQVEDQSPEQAHPNLPSLDRERVIPPTTGQPRHVR